MRREEGAVLLVVLVALAILAALTGVAMRAGRSGLEGLAAERAVFARDGMAQSALAVLGVRLGASGGLAEDGTMTELAVPGGAVQARVQAAEGLVNPLFARLPLVQAAFRAAGASPDQALALARAVGQARAEGRLAGPWDMAALVGDRRLWQRLRPFLTFLGQRETVDPGKAPPALRAELGPDVAVTVDLSRGTSTVRGLYEIDLTLSPGAAPVHYAVLRDRAGRMHVLQAGWAEDAGEAGR